MVKDNNNYLSLESFLSICVFPILTFYVNRYYFPNNTFFDSSFLERDVNPDCELMHFNLNDFLLLHYISGSQYLNSDIVLAYHYDSEKFVILKSYKGTRSKIAFDREIELYNIVRHKSIIKCHGWIETRSFQRRRYLVLPYMCNMSLREKIPTLSNTEKSLILIDIIYGLDYLHSLGIMHRDIKPDNILLDNNMNAYICDFDCCQTYITSNKIDRNLQQSHQNIDTNKNIKIDNLNTNENIESSSIIESERKFTNEQNSLNTRIESKKSLIFVSNIESGIGTKQFMSPENIIGGECSFQSDLFSFGMLLYQLCTGNPPYFSRQEYEIDDLIKNGVFPCLSALEYGKVVSLYNICKKLKVTGRSATFYLIRQIYKNQLFFVDSDLDLVYKRIKVFDHYNTDFSENRADYRAILDTVAKNDVDSIYFYGKMLKNGIVANNNRIDNKTALLIFQKAAELGHAESIYKVGRYYFQCYGEIQKECVKYFKKASEMGHVKAIYYYGISATDGINSEIDEEEAINYIATASASGCSSAKFFLSINLLANEEKFELDIELSKILLDQAASLNHEKAILLQLIQITRENIYESPEDQEYIVYKGYDKYQSYYNSLKRKIVSEGIRRDDTEYHKYLYHKAIDENDAECQRKIGIFCIIEYNFDYAYQWFYKASQNYDGKSMFILAALTEKNNLKAAIEKYIEASNHGSHHAKLRLAQIYMKNENTIKNAIVLLKELVNEQKYIYAMPILGEFYFHGKYLPKNIDMACEMFLMSDNLPKSAYYLGLIYENGLYFKKKYTESNSLF
ncbi:hypothetical protein TRFO_33023 [Tritrichomonas foetus]|uniref:Protein kinase domain-containing protein n=1 Tax=Tritrichomonas foetus TaxID=1144522 RepID=A0A1J4JMM1_9EUKA|nr:hypothetical protein TRFO_33023 [Tritrichomonas foetus]|eukprot:OHT00369.1 hypothetical protein TRFO_33023 [Tritrichomonas foetus]